MTDAPAPARLVPIAFDALAGWADDDHAAAFSAFRRSAERILVSAPTEKPLGPAPAALAAAARAALALPAEPDPATARAFFETAFAPHAVEPAAGAGFVTGYFEPEIAGSAVRMDAFPVPLYGMPADLVEVKPGDDRRGLDESLTWARRRPDGGLEPFPDRAAIMAGAIEGKAPVLAFVADWVDAFFVHVQGSARVRLADGRVVRLTFAGKSGHPYYPIARALVERGLMEARQATADVLRRWLVDHPEDAPVLMAKNRSFIFFREAPVPDPALGPVAAAGVPLTPGRSLAIDRGLTTFHVPIFVDAAFDGDVPGFADAFRRLMVAQDTGSAILGPARGDIFFGSGDVAGRIAGRMAARGRFIVLRPRGQS